MCHWGTDAPVVLNRPREVSGRTTIMVDACIAPEVQILNDTGVWTLGCCCGHGQAEPHALIHFESVAIARSLGYDPQPYDGHIYEIRLSGGE